MQTVRDISNDRTRRYTREHGEHGDRDSLHLSMRESFDDEFVSGSQRR